jgi:hypothetical protein
MTKYVQKPTGWWQDDKGRMQPPGSLLDPSLRVGAKLSPETADRRSSTGFVRRFLGALRRHSLSPATPAPSRKRSADIGAKSDLGSAGWEPRGGLRLPRPPS